MPRRGPEETFLGFAPATETLRKVVVGAATHLASRYPHVVPPRRQLVAQPFPSEDAMIRFHNAHPQRLFAGLAFDIPPSKKGNKGATKGGYPNGSLPEGPPLPPDLSYTIHMNASYLPSTKMSHAEPYECRPYDEAPGGAHTGIDNTRPTQCTSHKYLTSGLLALHESVLESLVALLTGDDAGGGGEDSHGDGVRDAAGGSSATDNKDNGTGLLPRLPRVGVQVSQASLPPFRRKTFAGGAFRLFVSVYMVLALLPLVQSLVAHLVREKESLVKDTTLRMGLRESVYWLGWMVTYGAMAAVTVVITVASASLFGLFPQSSLAALFLLFFSYALSLVAGGFLLSVVVTSTSLGAAVALVIMLVAGFVLGLTTALWHRASPSAAPLTLWLATYSPVGFGVAMDLLVQSEAMGDGLHLGHMFTRPIRLPGTSPDGSPLIDPSMPTFSNDVDAFGGHLFPFGANYTNATGKAGVSSFPSPRVHVRQDFFFWSEAAEAARSGFRGVTLGSLALMFLLDAALYGIAAWYLDNVWPHEGRGAKQRSWLFFLSARYWTPAGWAGGGGQGQGQAYQQQQRRRRAAGPLARTPGMGLRDRVGFWLGWGSQERRAAAASPSLLPSSISRSEEQEVELEAPAPWASVMRGSGASGPGVIEPVPEGLASRPCVHLLGVCKASPARTPWWVRLLPWRSLSEPPPGHHSSVPFGRPGYPFRGSQAAARGRAGAESRGPGSFVGEHIGRTGPFAGSPEAGLGGQGPSIGGYGGTGPSIGGYTSHDGDEAAMEEDVAGTGREAPLRSVDLTIYEGEAFAVCGQAGGGKSSLLQVIAGVAAPTAGVVSVYGSAPVADASGAGATGVPGDGDAARRTGHRADYGGLGVCPDANICLGGLTLMEQLEFFARIKGARDPKTLPPARRPPPTDTHTETARGDNDHRGGDACSQGGPACAAGLPAISEVLPCGRGTPRDMAIAILEELGLTEHADKMPGHISAKERRLLSLALCLVGDPQLIVLDQPTAHLDDDTRALAWRALEARCAAGRTVVFSSDALDEVEARAGRMAILSRGTLQCVGTPEFLKARFGLGYQLYLSKLPHFDPAATLSLIQAVMPAAQYGKTVGTAGGGDTGSANEVAEAIVKLPLGAESAMEAVLLALDEARFSLGVGEVALQATSLEDVLVTLQGDDAVGDAGSQGGAERAGSGATPAAWALGDLGEAGAEPFSFERPLPSSSPAGQVDPLDPDDDGDGDSAVRDVHDMGGVSEVGRAGGGAGVSGGAGEAASKLEGMQGMAHLGGLGAQLTGMDSRGDMGRDEGGHAANAWISPHGSRPAAAPPPPPLRHPARAAGEVSWHAQLLPLTVLRFKLYWRSPPLVAGTVGLPLLLVLLLLCAQAGFVSRASSQPALTLRDPLLASGPARPLTFALGCLVGSNGSNSNNNVNNDFSNPDVSGGGSGGVWRRQQQLSPCGAESGWDGPAISWLSAQVSSALGRVGPYLAQREWTVPGSSGTAPSAMVRVHELLPSPQPPPPPAAWSPAPTGSTAAADAAAAASQPGAPATVTVSYHPLAVHQLPMLVASVQSALAGHAVASIMEARGREGGNGTTGRNRGAGNAGGMQAGATAATADSPLSSVTLRVHPLVHDGALLDAWGLLMAYLLTVSLLAVPTSCVAMAVAERHPQGQAQGKAAGGYVPSAGDFSNRQYKATLVMRTAGMSSRAQAFAINVAHTAMLAFALCSVTMLGYFFGNPPFLPGTFPAVACLFLSAAPSLTFLAHAMSVRITSAPAASTVVLIAFTFAGVIPLAIAANFTELPGGGLSLAFSPSVHFKAALLDPPYAFMAGLCIINELAATSARYAGGLTPDGDSPATARVPVSRFFEWDAGLTACLMGMWLWFAVSAVITATWGHDDIHLVARAKAAVAAKLAGTRTGGPTGGVTTAGVRGAAGASISASSSHSAGHGHRARRGNVTQQLLSWALGRWRSGLFGQGRGAEDDAGGGRGNAAATDVLVSGGGGTTNNAAGNANIRATGATPAFPLVAESEEVAAERRRIDAGIAAGRWRGSLPSEDRIVLRGLMKTFSGQTMGPTAATTHATASPNTGRDGNATAAGGHSSYHHRDRGGEESSGAHPGTEPPQRACFGLCPPTPAPLPTHERTGLTREDKDGDGEGPSGPAVGGVWLGVTGGEITALVGPQRAGKSTILGCLVGAVPPTEGQAYVARDLSDGDWAAQEAAVNAEHALPSHRTSRGTGAGAGGAGYINNHAGAGSKGAQGRAARPRVSIGFCPEGSWLFSDLTIREHLDLFATLKGLPVSTHHYQQQLQGHVVGGGGGFSSPPWPGGAPASFASTSSTRFVPSWGSVTSPRAARWSGRYIRPRSLSRSVTAAASALGHRALYLLTNAPYMAANLYQVATGALARVTTTLRGGGYHPHGRVGGLGYGAGGQYHSMSQGPSLLAVSSAIATTQGHSRGLYATAGAGTTPSGPTEEPVSPRAALFSSSSSAAAQLAKAGDDPALPASPSRPLSSSTGHLPPSLTIPASMPVSSAVPGTFPFTPPGRLPEHVVHDMHLAAMASPGLNPQPCHQEDPVERVLDELDLYLVQYMLVRDCGPAVRRRVELALALLGEPDVILLDDPFGGLDYAGRRRVKSALARLASGGSGADMAAPGGLESSQDLASPRSSLDLPRSHLEGAGTSTGGRGMGGPSGTGASAARTRGSGDGSHGCGNGRRAAVLLATRSLAEAESTSSRIGLLVGGTLRALGSAQALRRHQVSSAHYLRIKYLPGGPCRATVVIDGDVAAVPAPAAAAAATATAHPGGTAGGAAVSVGVPGGPGPMAEAPVSGPDGSGVAALPGKDEKGGDEALHSHADGQHRDEVGRDRGDAGGGGGGGVSKGKMPEDLSHQHTVSTLHEAVLFLFPDARLVADNNDMHQGAGTAGPLAGSDERPGEVVVATSPPVANAAMVVVDVPVAPRGTAARHVYCLHVSSLASLARLFGCLTRHGKAWGVDTYSVSQPSLQQLFQGIHQPQD
eukprot:jgi/Mesvir1/12008/Mv00311-RA.1